MSYQPTVYARETYTMDDASGGGKANSPTLKDSKRRNIYRGFSTATSNGKSFSLTDKALVQRDILNHIYTIPGERVGRPDFGTLIPMIGFEPATPETIQLIESELRKVVGLDPRVELVNIAVMALPDNNAIVAAMDLRYVELDDQVDTLSITIGNN